MEFFEIGSVTYCTNVPTGQYPSDDESEHVASQIADIFDTRLRESAFADELVVVRVEFALGCILTTLTIGATATALYKFVKEYPKFRPGLMLLFKDLNGIYVRLKDSAKEGSTYLMRGDMPEQGRLKVIAEESKVGTREPAKVTKRIVRRTN